MATSPSAQRRSAKDVPSPTETVKLSTALRRQDTRGVAYPGQARVPSNIVSSLDHRISYRIFRIYQDYIGAVWPLMVLEFSGHGVPYIIIPVLTFLLWDDAPSPLYYVLLVNFFIGIITDLLWSVVLKPTCRRVRPYWAGQKQLGTVETVDQYSFPSGHSTRAVFVAFFVHYVYTVGIFTEQFSMAVSIWAGCICVSRVLLGRHHLGDVIVGALIGYINYELVRCIWVDENSVMWLRAELLALIATVISHVNNSIGGEKTSSTPEEKSTTSDEL